LLVFTDHCLDELDKLGAVLVAASGNSDNEDPYTPSLIPADDLIPAWARDPNGIPNIIIVGASTRMGRVAPYSQVGPGLTVYAPGDGVDGAGARGRVDQLFGTSLGMILSIPFYHYSTSSRHASWPV
jgi:hypothetical protein